MPKIVKTLITLVGTSNQHQGTSCQVRTQVYKSKGNQAGYSAAMYKM